MFLKLLFDMKKFTLSLLLLFICSLCFSQPVQPTYQSLNENFNNACTSTQGFPTDWDQFAEFGNQHWSCSPDGGLNNSPCMTVNDYTTTHNIDTQILYTPRLDLSAYSHIYLNFFDRYARNGDSLGVYVTNENGTADPLCDSCSWTKIVVPFSQDDTAWIEHQIDLTPYKAKQLYVAFKYTSSASTGSIWYLDSVFTTEQVYVPNVVKENIPLTVVGPPGSGGILLECTIPAAGQYRLALYDITGRTVYWEQTLRNAGKQRIAINNKILAPGMYIVKLNNENYSGFAKAVVQ